MAAGRECGEASFNLALKTASGRPGEGAVTEVEAEVPVLVPDEVEDREARLVVRES